MHKVFKQGEPILQQESKLVEECEFGSPLLINIAQHLQSIQSEMKAVGFSAPQLGHSIQMMLIGMEFENSRRPNVKIFPNLLFINPEIISFSDEQEEDWEGCASIDDTLALVSRPIHITYNARDLFGNYITGELSHFPARVFQHELDHLQGILMTNRAQTIQTVDPNLKIISLKS